MAKTTVGAEVQVEYKSVGEMRKAIKEATGDVIRMQEQFGATSKEAMAAAKRVTDLKDRIKDATEIADLFDPGNKFKALGNTVMVAANGFTALQGAMGLLGVESAEVEKQLLKVQSAMALTQSLSALADSGKEFSRLAAMIKGPVVQAFTTLRGAIIATGFGALAVAIGMIVANWEKIVGLVNGVNREQKELNKTTEANVKAQTDKLDKLDKQDASLKLQGKSEKEILQLKIEQVKAIIEATKQQLENAKITQKLQEDAAKRNQEILAGYLKWIQAPVVLLAKALDGMASLVGRDLGLEDKIDQLTKYAASFVFDPAETKAKGEENIKAIEENIETLNSKLAGFQLQQKQAADAQTKAAQDRSKQERDRIEAQRIKDLEAEIEFYGKRYEIEIEYLRKQRAAREQAEREQQERLQREKAANDAAFQRQVANLEAIRNKTLQNNQELQNAEQEFQNAKFGIVEAGFQVLNALFGRQTKMAKILALAEIATGTAKGFIQGLDIAQKSAAGTGPAAAFAFPIFYATQIAAVLGAVARAKSALTNPGVSGGSGSRPPITTTAPVQAQLSTPAQAQLLNAQAINNMGNQAVQAYVLNSDLQNNNQINAFLQRNASIG